MKIDPALVPFQTLRSGARIPAIGLGTFGSDKYSGSEIASAVLDAAEVGYRHFDCASVYGNEALIGESFEKILNGGIDREELFITSKLWNDKHEPKAAVASCEQTLKDLRQEYLDLYLIHWPFPNFHAAGVDVTSRDPHAVPFSLERYMETWRSLESLVGRGLVRHIGTSNMTIGKLTGVLEKGDILPAVNEMELHPHFQQPQLFEFVVSQGIVPVGYSPLGSPSRPERDRTVEDTVDTEDPLIVEIASRHGISVASVCIKWAIQRGQIPIPFSVKQTQYLGSLLASISDSLTDEEMANIAQIDKNCRLIKGQVFLWAEALGWEDLWKD